MYFDLQILLLELIRDNDPSIADLVSTDANLRFGAPGLMLWPVSLEKLEVKLGKLKDNFLSRKTNEWNNETIWCPIAVPP